MVLPVEAFDGLSRNITPPGSAPPLTLRASISVSKTRVSVVSQACRTETLVPTVAAAGQLATEWRAGYLECGRTQVRALAECYEATPHCVSETLSFSRPERRVRVGLHGHYEARTIAKVPVQVLDYRAASWACVCGTRRIHGSWPFAGSSGSRSNPDIASADD